MAERYYRTLKQSQPRGPYYLLGWSLGGALTMELASRLERDGETVAFVGLLDSYVPGTEVVEDQWSSPQAQATLREHLGLLLPGVSAAALDECIFLLRNHQPPQWPQQFSTWLSQQPVDAMVADSARQLLHSWAVEQHLRDLCWGYQLPSLKTPCHAWWAAQPPGRAEMLKNGIEQRVLLAQSEVLMTDHVGIVREPEMVQWFVERLSSVN